MNLCPRDRQTLASNDVSGYRYYSCEQCQGFWIPGASLRHVLSDQGATELRSVPRGGKSDLRCPACRTDCDALEIEGCRLDHCPKCNGVWLDAGEVLQVRRLFPEESAVVMAGESRPSKEAQQAQAACSLVEIIGNLLMLILR